MGKDKQARTALVLSSVMFAALIVACGGHAESAQRSAELGAASPEAVVERISRAAENRDLFELAATIEPQGAREMAEGLTFIMALTVAFSAMSDGEAVAEQRMAQLEAIVTRHGLPGMDEEGPADRASLQEALADVDHLSLAALIADLGEFMQTMAEGDEEINSEFLPPFDGELVDLRIDGDSASGRIGEEDIEFVRIDGRWFARLPEPADTGFSSGTDSASWGDWDSRNSAGSEAAETLSVPMGREDQLDQDGRRWYRFQASESGTLRLATRSTGSNDGDLVLEAWLDEDFSQSVARSDSDMGGDRANEAIEFGLQAGQVLHLRAHQFGFGRDAVSYRLEASFTPGEVEAWQPPPAMSYSGPDYSDEASAAVALSVGESRELSLGEYETQWFVISAPAAGTLSLTTRGTGDNDGDIKLEAFHGSSLSQVADYSDMDMLGDYSHEIVRLELAAGEQMFVRVSQWGGRGDAITYQLSTEFAGR